MNVLLFILLGLISGVAGGMGMGGGTILIPLVTLLLNVAQKEAQLLNIFSFIIMAIFVIGFHIKNKLVDIFPAIVFSILGVGSAIFSACLVGKVEDNTLKVLFGVFLIVLALLQLIVLLVKKFQKK